MVLIKERLKAARDRQKSYADNRRKPLEVEVVDQVLLKVLPWKGVVRFGKKGKLAPRYVGLFEILEMIGPVAYQLRLPQELSSVHDTFHVSNLKKCLADAYLNVSLEEIKVDKTLRFAKEDYGLVLVHDIFQVSNLKKCLADANLHVPLEEIKVDKTLCFVEESVEIMDREVKKLKRSKIPIVK
nr:putative reverse transcriptase domain-containing protein [Tanacetum cinerariifolium]